MEDRIHRRVLSGFAWQGTSKLLVQVISWSSTIVVARLLDPADYGAMAVAGVFVSLLTILTELGLAQALTQRNTITEIEQDSVFWMSLLVGAGLCLLLYAIAPVIADFYGMAVLTPLLRLCGVSLIIGSIKTVPQAMLMRSLDFRSRALVEVWASLAGTATVVVLAFRQMGPWSLAWGMVVQQAVVTAGYLPAMGRWPRLRFEARALTGLARFSLDMTGSNVAYAITRGADVFVIGKFLGQHASGIYALAFQVATIPLDKIGTVFNQVAFPSLARLKESQRQCRALFEDLHKYLLFFAYPVLFGIAAVAQDLVAVVFGEKWTEAAPVLQALCVANVMRISAVLIAPALASRGDSRTGLRFSVAAAVLLPSAFLLGVGFGLTGVAVAWIGVYPLLLALLLRALRREFGITLAHLFGQSRPTLAATAAMLAVVVTFQWATPTLAAHWRLAGSIGLGALVYAATYLIFFKDEVTTMRTALRSLRGGSSVSLEQEGP